MRYQYISYDIKTYPSLFTIHPNLFISQDKYHHFELSSANSHINLLKLSNEGGIKEAKITWFYHIEFATTNNNITFAIKKWEYNLDMSFINITGKEYKIGTDVISYGRRIIEISCPAETVLAFMIKADSANDNTTIGYVFKYYVQNSNKAYYNY